MDMPLRVDQGWTKTERLRVQLFLESAVEVVCLQGARHCPRRYRYNL